jgi:hypothetical protein
MRFNIFQWQMWLWRVTVDFVNIMLMCLSLSVPANIANFPFCCLALCAYFINRSRMTRDGQCLRVSRPSSQCTRVGSSVLVPVAPITCKIRPYACKIYCRVMKFSWTKITESDCLFPFGGEGDNWLIQPRSGHWLHHWSHRGQHYLSCKFIGHQRRV